MSLLHAIGFLGALITGLLLGLVGGGGSLLAVPILTVLFSVGPETATQDALLVVGLTSSIGVADHLRQRTIHWPSVARFGLPSLLTVWLTRHWLLPLLPTVLVDTSFLTLTKTRLISLGFVLVMVVAAVGMLRPTTPSPTSIPTDRNTFVWKLSAQGVAVGLLTGLVGTGGGFLIVPGLVILAGLPLTVAVGTSLLLVCLNSLVGFISTSGYGPPSDYSLLLLFSALSVGGVLLGNRLARYVPTDRLRPAFGYFMLLVSIGMLIHEFY